MARLRETFAAGELRKFLIGTIAWGTAHQMVTIAQGYIIFEITDSKLQLGILGGAVTAASITMAVAGGIMADRVSRKALLMIGSAITSMAMLAIGALMLSDNLMAWHVQVAGAVQGATLALDWTARFALLPNMIERHILARAVPFDLTFFNLSRTVAPLLWGWIATLHGAEWTYIVICLLFILNFGIASRFRPLENSARLRHAAIWEDVSEIMNIVRSNPIVAGNLIFTAVNALLMGGFIYLLTPFAKEILQVGASGLGQLFAAVGIGAFAGGLALGVTGGSRRMGRVLIISNFLAAASAALFSFSSNAWAGIILALLFGMFNAIHIGLGNLSLQVAIADEARGRLAGIYELAWSGFPMGGFVLGALSAWIGVTPSIIVGASLVAIVTLAMAILNPSLLRLSHRG